MKKNKYNAFVLLNQGLTFTHEFFSNNFRDICNEVVECMKDFTDNSFGNYSECTITKEGKDVMNIRYENVGYMKYKLTKTNI